MVRPIHIISRVFPSDRFTVFMNDRPPNRKGQSHGGVLIAVTNQIPSSALPELQTNCEMVWAELSISNARKLLFCSFYRPHPDDDTSLPLLNESLSRINPNCKSVVIVGGNFNLGYMDWSVPSVITGKPNLQQHKLLLDIINDHSPELSETQNYAYWYARFFPGTHDFRLARVPRTHVFLVGTR